MKILHKISWVPLLAFAVMFSACEDFLDVNVDPNNPTEVSPDLLLTSAQSYLAYTVGGDINRYTGLFVQHYAGVQGQSQEEYDIYNFNDDETNNLWRFGIYAGSLGDLDLLIKQADETGSPHYSGIAKVMTAYGIGLMADLFGQVPYSQAFQFSDNVQPTYDNQETLYATIETLLNDGIADLSAATSTFVPGGDDLVFGGDMNKWIRFANFVKVRYYNHKSLRDPQGSAQAVLNLLDGSDPVFESMADDAAYVFFASPNSTNPLFQFEQQRGQIAVSDVVLDEFMMPLSDPRIPLYAAPIADLVSFVGAPNGSATQDQGHALYSAVGPFHATADAVVPFGTYYELKFIEAEAAFRTGDKPRAYDAYKAAIKAHFDYLEAGIIARPGSLAGFELDPQAYDDYVAQTAVDPGSADAITLQLIMEQKYLAMFSRGAESWTDWRRTGFPVLAPADNNLTSNVIPVRFPYPESEFSFNQANVPIVTILDPTWFQDGTED